ncbi:MAG: hypothetical protein AB7O96_11465 [Pseudobdellovibrionaceae bacterium]
MKRLNVAQIKNLMTYESKNPCISLYLPLSYGRQVVKRVLQNCENQLLSFYPTKIAAEMMSSVEKAVEKIASERKAGTLCVFKSMDIEGYTISCEDYASETHVSSQFYLKPMLETLQGYRDFHVLVINNESADLIKCNSNEYQVVWTSGPRLFSNRSQSQALDYLSRVGVETYLLENKFANQLSAFAEISLKISSFLNETEPFFLCASRKAATQFRLVSNHSNLMPGLISDHLVENYREVFLEGIKLARPYWQNQDYDLLAHVLQQKASEKLITDIEKILQMLEEKKVSTLFVAKDSHLWGELNRSESSARFFERNSSEKESVQVQDLSGILANKVLEIGRQVRLVESKWLEGAAVAALKEGDLDFVQIVPLNRIWFNPKGNLLDLRK